MYKEDNAISLKIKTIYTYFSVLNLCWVPSQSRKRLVVEFYVGSVDSAFAASVCKALNGATKSPQLTVVN